MRGASKILTGMAVQNQSKIHKVFGLKLTKYFLQQSSVSNFMEFLSVILVLLHEQKWTAGTRELI
jgi:hypothetical protein